MTVQLEVLKSIKVGSDVRCVSGYFNGRSGKVDSFWDGGTRVQEGGSGGGYFTTAPETLVHNVSSVQDTDGRVFAVGDLVVLNKDLVPRRKPRVVSGLRCIDSKLWLVVDTASDKLWLASTCTKVDKPKGRKVRRIEIGREWPYFLTKLVRTTQVRVVFEPTPDGVACSVDGRPAETGVDADEAYNKAVFVHEYPGEPWSWLRKPLFNPEEKNDNR